MGKPTNDEALIALLRRGDPANGDGASESSVHRLLGDSIDSAQAPSRRRSRQRQAWFAGGLAGALALALSAPVINAVVAQGESQEVQSATSQELVTTPTPSPTFQVGQGSMPIEEGAAEPDSAVIVRGAQAASTGSEVPAYISFPAEESSNVSYSTEAVESQMLSASGEFSAATAAPTGVAAVEAGARCAWTQEWLVATAAEDDERADAAASILKSAATWPATLSLGESVVSGFAKAAEAAASGDVMAVRGEFIHSCTTLLFSPDREDE